MNCEMPNNRSELKKSRKSVTEKAGELLRPVDLFKFTAVDVPTESKYLLLTRNAILNKHSLQKIALLFEHSKK